MIDASPEGLLVDPSTLATEPLVIGVSDTLSSTHIPSMQHFNSETGGIPGQLASPRLGSRHSSQSTFGVSRPGEPGDEERNGWRERPHVTCSPKSSSVVSFPTTANLVTTNFAEQVVGG